MNNSYFSLNQYCRETFGHKLYKLALNAGLTCPNRDGTLGTRGCLFCSTGGSGEFAASAARSVTGQIEEAKTRVAAKVPADVGYIAYFQAYTNTYGPVEYLRTIFMEAILHPDIEVLAIATRPDCLPKEVLDLLEELNQIKPVWVELGLQTIHEHTAKKIRRGYPLFRFDESLQSLRKRKLEIVVHVILGLPGESREDMLATIDYLAKTDVQGIKLQLLHVLKDTDLAEEYAAGRCPVMEMEEYLDLLCECLRRLPPHMVIHRLTGDGPKSLLLAPAWSADKKRVWNALQHTLAREHVVQGESLHTRILKSDGFQEKYK